MISERDVLLILVGALDHQKDHSLVRLAKHVLKVPEDKYLTTDKVIQKPKNVLNNGYTNEEILDRIEKTEKNKKDLVHLPRRHKEFIRCDKLSRDDLPEIPPCLKTNVVDDYKGADRE